MKVIFHSVMPIVENGISGSEIRPRRMLEAFRELGCEVDVVDGYSLERRGKILKVINKIESGAKYDLLYSESGTDPVLLADPLRRSLDDFNMDRDFIRFVKLKGIRTGIFYRDIYWRFMALVRESSPFSLGKIKDELKIIARNFLYRYDLLWYRKYFDLIYLPSLEMKIYLPEFSALNVVSLPPGHGIKKSVITKADQFNLVYVGGVTGVYDLSLVLDVVSSIKDVEFYLCSRENEWKQALQKYSSTLAENIHNVHLSGDQLRGLYQNMTIACLYLQPNEYRTFAQPVKLYEYIGYGLPILASRGTLAGDMVERYNIGWSREYDHRVLLELFNRLLGNPSEVQEKRNNVLKIRDQHTWKARARQVIEDLR